MTDNEKAANAEIYIADMGFSVRVYNHLILAGFYTTEDLLSIYSLDVLLKRRGFGQGARMEVISKMRQQGHIEWADRMDVK